MGVGGSVQPNELDEDDAACYASEAGDRAGIEQRIPIEFQPRKRLGKAHSQHQLSFRSFTNSSFTNNKKMKGASLRSVLSNDTVLEFETNADYEKLKREFDNFKLNKQNEIQDMQKREKKLESENKRLRGEIQALQKVATRLRMERDTAYENEHQALERAAVFEQDRDNIQRQLRVLQDQAAEYIHANSSGNTVGHGTSTGLLGYTAHNDSEHVSSESSYSPQPRISGSSARVPSATAPSVTDPLTSPGVALANLNIDTSNVQLGSDASPHSTLTGFKFEASVKQTVISTNSQMPSLTTNPDDFVFSGLEFVIGFFESQLNDDAEQFKSAWSNVYEANLLENFGINMDVSIRHLSAEQIPQMMSSTNVAIIFLEKKLSDLEYKCLSGMLATLNNNATFKALFCFKQVDQNLIGSKMIRFKKLLNRVNANDFFNTISIENYSQMEPLIELVNESVDQFVVRHFSHGVLGECPCYRDFHMVLYQNDALSSYLQNAATINMDEHLFCINQHIVKEGPVPPLVIKSERGQGKSTLLAHFLRTHKSSHLSTNVLYHFTECSTISQDGALMMRRFLAALNSISNNNSVGVEKSSLNNLDNFTRLLETFPRNQRSQSTHRPLLIIAIDSADCLENATLVLDWIRDPLPVDVRVILTVTPGSCPDEWEGMPSLLVVSQIPRAPVHALCQSVQTVVNKVDLKSPLLLNLLMKTDLSFLDEIQNSSKDIIFCYLKSVASTHSITLFQVSSILLYIGLCFQGIRLNWLVKILAPQNSSTTDFHHLMSTLCQQLTSTGILSFRRGNYIIGHGLIQDHVFEYVLQQDPKMIETARTVILSFFDGLEFSDDHLPFDVVLEEVYQLRELKLMPKLESFVCKVVVFMHLYKFDYCHLLIDIYQSLNVSKDRITDQFSSEISQLERSPQMIDTLTDTLESFAAFNRDLGLFSKAAQLYQKSLETRELNLDPDHPSVGRTLYLYALLHFKWSKFDIAESYLRQSIGIQESCDFIQYSQLVESYELLGILFQCLGKLKPAEVNSKKLVYLRSMACINEFLDSSGVPLSVIVSDSNPDTVAKANYLNELAVLTYYQGHIEDAEIYFKNSLTIRQKLLGESHLDCAQSMFNLGGLYLETKQYSKSLECFEKSLQIRKAGNATSMLLLSTYRYLSTVYRKAGSTNKAVAVLKESLKLNLSTFGDGHHFVATNYANLASVFSEMKNHREALPLYERALEIYKRTYGDSDSRVSDTLTNMALLKYEMNEYGEAAQLYKQAMECRDDAVISRRTSEVTSVASRAGTCSTSRSSAAPDQFTLM